VPARLAERDLTLEPDKIARAARAHATVEHGAETMPDDYAALARLLLRAEGVASSLIEGVTAPVVDIRLRRRTSAARPCRVGGAAAARVARPIGRAT